MATNDRPSGKAFPVSFDRAVEVHKFLDGEKVDLVRNKTLEGKPQLVKAVCGGAKMKYGVKRPSAQHFKIKDLR